VVWVILLMLVTAAVVAGALYYWAHRQGLLIPETRNVTGRGRISLLTESVAYAGAGLVLVGSGITVGQTWHDVSAWEHVWLFAGAAALLLAIGLVAWRFTDPAVQRLIGVTWFGSAACVATATGVAAHDVYGQSGAVTAITVGLVVTIYSTALWLFRRRELEMVAVFTGLIITICGAVLTAADNNAPWLAVALGMWGLGIGWTVLAWRYPEPLWTTVPLAGALALVAPSIAVWSHGWMFVIGITTAAAALATSFALRNPVLLVFGAFALAGYIAATIVRYFHDLLGIPETLTIAGVILIALAIVSTRLRRESRSRQAHENAGHENAGYDHAEQNPTGQGPAGQSPVYQGPARQDSTQQGPTQQGSTETHPTGLDLPRAS